MMKFSNIIGLLFIIIAILLISFIIMRENNLFLLNQAKIVGNHRLSDEEIIELVKIDFSKELFSVNLDAIAERLLTHPLITAVNISRDLPSAIKIKIEEKDLLAVAPGSTLEVLDAGCQLVHFDQSYVLYDLPIITGANFTIDAEGNKVASPMMVEMTLILKALRVVNYNLYQEISEIHYDNKTGYLLFLRDHGIPLILGEGDLARKINYLTVIYNYLQQKNKLSHIQTVDVRFNGQVVIRE